MGNNKYLDNFYYNKFKISEKFQESDMEVDSSEFYNDGYLRTELFLNKEGDENNTIISFNSSLEDYMYPNENNDNSQYMSKNITICTKMLDINKVTDSWNPCEPEEIPLEFFQINSTPYLTETNTIKLKENTKIKVSNLISEQIKENVLGGENDNTNLKVILKIDTNQAGELSTKYKFNDTPQDHIYSNNLLFKASMNGVETKLITPSVSVRKDGDNIPSGFKLNIHNHKYKLNRGKKATKAFCDWMEFGRWILLAILLIYGPVGCCDYSLHSEIDNDAYFEIELDIYGFA